MENNGEKEAFKKIQEIEEELTLKYAEAEKKGREIVSRARAEKEKIIKKKKEELFSARLTFSEFGGNAETPEYKPEAAENSFHKKMAEKLSADIFRKITS